jgi:protein TonB
MRIEICEKMRTWNLRIFFSISMGLHLLFFTTVTLLFPDFKIDRLPPLNIEVSLLPIVAQERSLSLPLPARQVKTQTKKEEKKPEPPLPSQPETKVTPISDPQLEDLKSEVSNRGEEKVEKEPIIQAMTIALNPETVVTFQRDKSSESQGSALPNISSSEEPMRLVKYPSLSEGETILTQPRYAENPKPLYPQEARKRGYQGEVVLKVEILSNGRVGRVEVKRSSGHEILDRSAFATVKEWRFVPAKKGENPIPFWVNIPIKFELQ